MTMNSFKKFFLTTTAVSLALGVSYIPQAYSKEPTIPKTNEPVLLLKQSEPIQRVCYVHPDIDLVFEFSSDGKVEVHNNFMSSGSTKVREWGTYTVNDGIVEASLQSYISSWRVPASGVSSHQTIHFEIISENYIMLLSGDGTGLRYSRASCV